MVLAHLAALSSVLLTQARPVQVAPGDMVMLRKGVEIGFCPLERTSVKAQVNGYGAEVTVVQKFKNTSTTPIEAVYTFPLPNDAAVGRMRMKIGDRIIEGQIKKRDEARLIYEQAKAAGQAAALLDQERPNIFTQSVANITPGANIEVEITYVQVLKYDSGEFEFNFPMVVGPRFLGNTPDPTKVDPPRTTRTGTNIDISVDLMTGGTIRGLRSVLHEIDQKPNGKGGTSVSLKKEDEIPNKDFILRYALSGETVDTAFLTHTDARGGFFSLVVLPPKQPTAAQIAPREVIFVMDQSGSQSGFPIEKSKELTLSMIQTMRPGDTFNVIGFNNTVRKLWDTPQPLNPENLRAAREFVSGMQANGGTQLRDGVIAALTGTRDPRRLRIVLFNTDGYVGDEAAVLDSIQKQRDTARMFTFGIGNSVNRYLIDAMAEEGRGDAEYVTLAEAAGHAVSKFAKRMSTPVLTNVTAQFSGVTVSEVQPNSLPDVFADRPIVIHGRFTGNGTGSVVLKGDLGGKPWSKTLSLDFAANKAPAVPVLWARKKVTEIERTDYIGAFRGQARTPSVDAITKVGLDFGIMTQYTSFVAVEQRVINVGGKQRTVNVPVEQADGVIMNTGGPGGTLSSFAAPATIGTTSRNVGGASSGGIGGGGLYRGSKASEATLDKSVMDPSLRVMKPEERAKNKKLFIDAKVHTKLKSASGKVEVQIFVEKLDDKTLALLKSKGVTVAGKDTGLKVIFATIDAAKLGDLAILDEVVRIDPL